MGSLPPGVALGQGPFREVRLLIDGQVAGTAFPYATIFTGGIDPTVRALFQPAFCHLSLS